MKECVILFVYWELPGRNMQVDIPSTAFASLPCQRWSPRSPCHRIVQAAGYPNAPMITSSSKEVRDMGGMKEEMKEEWGMVRIVHNAWNDERKRSVKNIKSNGMEWKHKCAQTRQEIEYLKSGTRKTKQHARNEARRKREKKDKPQIIPGKNTEHPQHRKGGEK
ncbi:hypothetical protein BJ165DRAFT_1402663 [Panaeolus papilionaceus]|nr:hypothetical protein BJ165DRAFT_1402663 [Panaeolus papilionaceus]